MRGCDAAMSSTSGACAGDAARRSALRCALRPAAGSTAAAASRTIGFGCDLTRSQNPSPKLSKNSGSHRSLAHQLRVDASQHSQPAPTHRAPVRLGCVGAASAQHSHCAVAS